MEPAAPQESFREKKGMGVIFLTLLIDLIGFSIIFPLGPKMLEWYLWKEGPDSLLGQWIGWMGKIAHGNGVAAEFSVSVFFGGILAALFSVLQFLCSPLWGRLSDRIGRRPVLLLTVAGTAISYALWIISAQFWQLLLARFLGGIMSGNISVATAAVADITSKKKRSGGMAIIGIAFGLGFILGPVIGGTASLSDLSPYWPATDSWGLHPFSLPALLAFLLSVINWLWVWFRFEESFEKEKRGRSNRDKVGLWSGWRHLTHPGLQQLVPAYFLYILAFSGMEFSLTFLAAERLHYGPMENASLFVYIGIIMVIVQGGLTRRLAPRFGEKPLAVFGLLSTSIGFFLLAWAESIFLFYVGNGLVAIGAALSSPTLTGLASLYSTEQDQGRDLGIFRSAGSLGRAIGPLLCAPLYFWIGSLFTYIVGSLFLLLPLYLASSLPSPERQEEGDGGLS